MPSRVGHTVELSMLWLMQCSMLAQASFTDASQSGLSKKRNVLDQDRDGDEGSNFDYKVWAIGIYLFTSNIKSISSMRTHRVIGIDQKAAWIMLHRLRKAYEAEVGQFAGPVDVDETFMVGRESNKYKSKNLITGRGAVGKSAAIIAKDRDINEVRAEVVEKTDRKTLHGIEVDSTTLEAQTYTDNASTYKGIGRLHATVNHSGDEYVCGRIQTNGVESFCAMFKRAHKGTYHKTNPKHLNRYVQEFVGRHNQRELDTIDQMSDVVIGMSGKRLRYGDLIADNGLDSGARK